MTQEKFKTSDIKIYQDAYANKESVLCGYKGKIIDEPGIIYCQYVKPSRIRRFINLVKSLFAKKRDVEELIEKTKL